MTAADPAASRGPSLSTKLSVAIGALAALLLLFLLGYVGPSTAERFRVRTDALVEHSDVTMQTLATTQAAEADSVLIELIEHTTDARRRAFEDLPLALYADPEQLRAAVREEDSRRSRQLRANAETLAIETRRRAERRIEAALVELRGEQRAAVAEISGQLRTTHLLLCAAFVAIATLVLGVGLWHLVVRPIGALRSATWRIANDELDAEVRLRSGDEIGALAADFSTMVGRLRRSRSELDALNAGLEQQVAEKTRELARVEKMAWIGTLAGGIAHEFNNLIGGIRGCAQEARLDETDPDRQETLDVILRAADRGAAITAQLLQFARRGEGNDPHADQPVELAPVLDDVLRLLEPEARRRGVEVLRDVATGLWTRGSADALHQVFVNLVTNALQAMPGGGRLTVRATAGPAGVTVQVIDTGVGIAAEDLDRIFEPFFSRRADDRDPAQRGTGLGLAVSFGIVGSHGGTIAVTSAPGAGSTFSVSLPRD